jgi:hypothetical protein
MDGQQVLAVELKCLTTKLKIKVVAKNLGLISSVGDP